MKNVRKAVVLLVAILAIFAFTRSVNAAAISTNKTANNTSNTSNTSNSANNTTNSVENETDEPTNTVANTVQNTYQPIGTSNAAENIPHAGIEDSYFNFALILLLTLVLGMFSLIQYNKIIKKDQEN